MPYAERQNTSAGRCSGLTIYLRGEDSICTLHFTPEDFELLKDTLLLWQGEVNAWPR